MEVKSKSELIGLLKPKFDIRELVCPEAYGKWGEGAWMFLSRDLLQVIWLLRFDVLNLPMTVNTWKGGGSYSERGLRCNLCSIPKGNTDKGVMYLSAHCMGQAIDFTCSSLDAEAVREMIRSYWKGKGGLPRIRLERGVSWVHIDVFDDGSDRDGCIEFNG